MTIAVLGGLAAAPVRSQQTAFVYIKGDDQNADFELRRLLADAIGGTFSTYPYDYDGAIINLADWEVRNPDHPYVARVTPYVFIAAEKLGAQFEVLGTYLSEASGGTTYHSYFVVNREALDGLVRVQDRRPTLDDVVEFIRLRAKRRSPARFIYHNKFSTSSYFLPTLFLRRNNIYATAQSTDRLLAIASNEVVVDSSSKLVDKVAAGEADLAAVWDATKKKFENADDALRLAVGAKVYFIPLPDELPNDLLVCSRSLVEKRAAEKLESLRDLLFSEKVSDRRVQRPLEIDIPGSDFDAWVDIKAAGRAPEALANLRWLASEQRSPVTVRIGNSPQHPVPPDHLEAARQAVRVSGNEFVLYDEGFHRVQDYDWELAWVRRGHITLRSRIPSFPVPGAQQLFPISFQTAAAGEEQQDLSHRIGNLVAARLHRLRYVWPYDAARPLVIRDVPFSLEKGALVHFATIEWDDPVRNGYSVSGDTDEIRIVDADFFRFLLDKDRFRTLTSGSRPLDPMSPVAYRVLLERPDEPQMMFTVFNATFALLLGVSGTGTAVAFRRSRRWGRPTAPPAAEPSGPHRLPPAGRG